MVGPAAVWVEGPPAEPRPYGLFTAAQVVEDTDARFLLGTRYDVDYCGAAYDSVGVCFDLGTLTVSVDTGGTATVTAAGYPVDGPYDFLWGDETGGAGAETASDLTGASHDYAPGTYTLTVTGPNSYGAVVTFTVAGGVAGGPYAATVGITKTPVSGIETVEGDPFAVLHLLECNPVGRTDLQERARRGLQMGEQRAVERVLSTLLARHPDAVTLNGGDPTTTVSGLAVLERYAGLNYPGRATIHATPDVVTLLDAAGAVTIRTVNGVEMIVTGNGTKVVSGGGYDLRAPTEDEGDALPANTAGKSWLYATGAVQVRRAPVIEVNSAIDTTAGTSARNRAGYLAERPYVVTWDCMVAAVQVDAGPAL